MKSEAVPFLRQRTVRFAKRGFTLVELVVTVAIIGILLAVAMPQYNEYLIRANKAAAKAVLMEIASRQEQYLTNPTYTDLLYGKYAAAESELNYTIPADVSRFYTISISACNPSATVSCSTVPGLEKVPTFTVTATPLAGTIQATSPNATFSINHFGLKLPINAW